MQHGDPIDCGRSDHNYPSLVNGAFGYSTFVDVSCGSAQTKDMTSRWGAPTRRSSMRSGPTRPS